MKCRQGHQHPEPRLCNVVSSSAVMKAAVFLSIQRTLLSCWKPNSRYLSVLDLNDFAQFRVIDPWYYATLFEHYITWLPLADITAWLRDFEKQVSSLRISTFQSLSIITWKWSGVLYPQSSLAKYARQKSGDLTLLRTALFLGVINGVLHVRALWLSHTRPLGRILRTSMRLQ